MLSEPIPVIIRNVAFIIPIHPPFYHYIYKLIHKIKNNNIHIDMFLVFSSHSDYADFNMKGAVKPIIIAGPINTKSIAVFKKFYGLHKMKNTAYDYFICCDAETDIVVKNFTDVNINKMIENIFNKKKIYAGNVSDDNFFLNINRVSANLFGHNQEKLRLSTRNFSLYCFWSDIPVYRRADMGNFFKMINYNSVIYNIVWEHFEHVIYQYYLILRCDFKIVNITPHTGIRGSLEKLNVQPNTLKALSALEYGFGWIPCSAYIRRPGYFNSKNTFIIYHLNRAWENH